jgi:CheY-like chemotaxis protein
MSDQVLFVDDEPHLLEAIQRTMRKRVAMHTAGSGAEGLKILVDKGPFALVISDMRMPEMNGAQFLSKVRELSPETVRMILSGQADLEATLSAVNEGHVFQFLSKPCPPDSLFAAIGNGLEQYRLVKAEKVLLEETLSGAVKMLIEILGLVSPSSSNRASRLQRYVNALVAILHLPERWQWPLAALISQIGCVALPKDLMSKVEAGQSLTDHEKSLHDSHPEVAGKLLATIPRLEDVAAIVSAQAQPTRIGSLANWRDADVRTLGQALLHTTLEFDRLIAAGMNAKTSAEQVRATQGIPAEMAAALAALPLSTQPWVTRQVSIQGLTAGMVLDQDLVSSKGLRIVPEGSEVTRTLIVKLISIASGVGVAEPFRVRVQL